MAPEGGNRRKEPPANFSSYNVYYVKLEIRPWKSTPRTNPVRARTFSTRPSPCVSPRRRRRHDCGVHPLGAVPSTSDRGLFAHRTDVTTPTVGARLRREDSGLQAVHDRNHLRLRNSRRLHIDRNPIAGPEVMKAFGGGPACLRPADKSPDQSASSEKLSHRCGGDRQSIPCAAERNAEEPPLVVLGSLVTDAIEIFRRYVRKSAPVRSCSTESGWPKRGAQRRLAAQVLWICAPWSNLPRQA